MKPGSNKPEDSDGPTKVPVEVHYRRSFTHCIVMAIISIFWMCLTEKQSVMYGFGAVVIFAIGYGFYCQSRIDNAVPGEMIVPMGVEGWSKRDQIRHYRRMLWVVPIFILLFIWRTVRKFDALETGAVNQVRADTLTSIMYECFGYWGAMIGFPALGLCALLISIVRLNGFSRRDTGFENGYEE